MRFAGKFDFGKMQPEFSEAAFALNIGEVSKVMRSTACSTPINSTSLAPIDYTPNPINCAPPPDN